MALYQIKTVDINRADETFKRQVGVVGSKIALREFIDDYGAGRHKTCTAYFDSQLSAEWNRNADFVGTGLGEMGKGFLSGNAPVFFFGVGRVLFGSAGGWLGLLDRDPFSQMVIGRIYPSYDKKTKNWYVCVRPLAF